MATKYQDIKRQIAELEKKAAEARKSEVAQAIADIRKMIAEFDLTPEDVFPKGRKAGVKAGKGAIKVARPAKYMDPKSGKTWSGMGKPPSWIAAAIMKGKKDDFLIAQVEKAREVKAAKVTAKVAAPKKAAKPAAIQPVTTKAVRKVTVVTKVATAKAAVAKAKAPVVATEKKKPVAPKKAKAGAPKVASVVSDPVAEAVSG